MLDRLLGLGQQPAAAKRQPPTLASQVASVASTLKRGTIDPDAARGILRDLARDEGYAARWSNAQPGVAETALLASRAGVRDTLAIYALNKLPPDFVQSRLANASPFEHALAEICYGIEPAAAMQSPPTEALVGFYVSPADAQAMRTKLGF